ncbi:hypothetical protein FRB94_008187 [Tulasnella sp. JGI-2019a]|nr:hypothetical protein FRB93_007709 [Tulasnella sp. JGI-2019a]KAG8996621.1 hypothetical protein FRB94_008187 [Tulasnella sp. JGI-2019a]
MRLSVFIISLAPIAGTFASPIPLTLAHVNHTYEPSIISTHNAPPPSGLSQHTVPLVQVGGEDLAHQLSHQHARRQYPSRGPHLRRGLAEMASVVKAYYKAFKTAAVATKDVAIALPKYLLRILAAYKMTVIHVGGEANVGTHPIDTLVTFGYHFNNDAVVNGASLNELQKIASIESKSELEALYKELRLKRERKLKRGRK